MIVLSAIERGIEVASIRKMTLGQVVDFVIEFNNRQEATGEDKSTKRWANQNDINAFLGG